MEALKIKKIKYNPTLEGMAEIFPDITYSTETGKELKLSIIAPCRDRLNEKQIPRYPLIVFVQGSAFTFPNIYYEIPQLSNYAQKGYVIATLTHRNCLEGNPFPAYLQDVKTAIRFLRKNADEYGIDVNRIGIWGTSSGGNTSLLVGLTQGKTEYITTEHAGYTDEVTCVVDCFGPTDLRILYERVKAEHSENPEDHGLLDIFRGLMGGEENETGLKLLDKMSPANHIVAGQLYPPFLLIHGDADELVPYNHSENMYKELLGAGIKAEMICVENAPHEGTFWSRQLHDLIQDFFAKNL